jgi:hypothetical protein
MMLPPPDPPLADPPPAGGPGPDSDSDSERGSGASLWLAELSEEELAGCLVEPTDEELAGLVEPAEEELAGLDARLAGELARLWLEPDAARWDGCADGGVVDDSRGGMAGLFGRRVRRGRGAGSAGSGAGAGRVLPGCAGCGAGRPVR